MKKTISHSENFHILLWLVKDICWCLTFRVPGLIMIVPTLFLAIYIMWKNKEVYSELMHNLAICFWISANSVWMIGEFFYEDGLRNYALICFIIGMVTLSIYYGRVIINFMNKGKAES